MSGDKVAVYEYLVIGGPLDGEYAASIDFDRGRDAGYVSRGFGNTGYRPRGKFADHRDDYQQYNAAVRRARRRQQLRDGGRQDTYPSMVWIHRSIIEGQTRRTRRG